MWDEPFHWQIADAISTEARRGVTLQVSREAYSFSSATHARAASAMSHYLFNSLEGRATFLIRHAHGHEDVEERAFDAEDAGAHFVDEI
jgi:hypothetical protein